MLIGRVASSTEMKTRTRSSSVPSVEQKPKARFRSLGFFSMGRYAHSCVHKVAHLFVRHYDVIAAGAASSWDHDPFQLTGFNGYLYGRGVSDNKGPVLAVACAASEMLARRSLDIDLVLLIEGEEEAGSGGFTEAVKKYKVSPSAGKDRLLLTLRFRTKLGISMPS